MFARLSHSVPILLIVEMDDAKLWIAYPVVAAMRSSARDHSDYGLIGYRRLIHINTKVKRPKCAGGRQRPISVPSLQIGQHPPQPYVLRPSHPILHMLLDPRLPPTDRIRLFRSFRDAMFCTATISPGILQLIPEYNLPFRLGLQPLRRFHRSVSIHQHTPALPSQTPARESSHRSIRPILHCILQLLVSETAWLKPNR